MPSDPLRSRVASSAVFPSARQLPFHRGSDHRGSETDSNGKAKLQALLTDLSSQVRRGETLEAVSRASSPRRLATGIPAVDALLQGGFPAGYLCEIAGPPSSGRTSLALSLLAHTTARTGELAAVVDRADSFDPSSAEAAGVDLERVLWARTTSEWRAALRCVERLLQTEGIPLILLEWIQPGPTIPAAAWTRLVRLAAGTRSALIVLSDQRLTGSQAHMVLEMQPTHPRFTGRPPLLEEIGARARLVRHRTGPPGRAVDLRLGATPPGRSHSAFHSPSHSASHSPFHSPSG